MLEELIKEKKQFMNKDKEQREHEINFIKRIFDENYKIIKEHIEKYNLSQEQAFDELTSIISNLKTPLHLSNDDGKQFQIKDVMNYLGVKLGLYEFRDKEYLNPELFVGQCPLDPTPKGRKVYSKYKRLNSS